MAFRTKEQIESYWLDLDDIRKIAAMTTEQIFEDRYSLDFTDATAYRIETRILAQLIVWMMDRGIHSLPPEMRFYGRDQEEMEG